MKKSHSLLIFANAIYRLVSYHRSLVIVLIFAFVCISGQIAGQNVTAQYNNNGTVTIENKSSNTIVIFKGNYSEASRVEQIITQIVDRNSEVSPDLTYFAGWCGFADNIAIRPNNSATSTNIECNSNVINYYIIRDFSNQIPGAKKCLMSGTSVKIEKDSQETPKVETPKTDTPLPQTQTQTQQVDTESPKDASQTSVKADEKKERTTNKQEKDSPKEVKKTETTLPKDEKPYEDYQIKYKIPITILENSCKEYLSKEGTLSEIEKAELKKELSKCDYFIRRIDEDKMIYEVYEKPHDELTEYTSKLKLLEMNILARLSSLSIANIDDIKQKYNTEILTQIQKNVQELDKTGEKIEATKQLHSLAQWKVKNELLAEINEIDSTFQVNVGKSDTFIEREKKRFSASEDIRFIEKLDNQIPDLNTTIGKYQYMVKKLKTPYFFFVIVGFLAIVVLYVIVKAVITSFTKKKRKRKSDNLDYQMANRTKQPYKKAVEPEPDLRPEIEEIPIITTEEKKEETPLQTKSGEQEVIELFQEQEAVVEKNVEQTPEPQPITRPVEEEKTNEPELQEAITEVIPESVVVENKIVEEVVTPVEEKVQPLFVSPVDGYFEVKNKIENTKIETIQLATQAVSDISKALNNNKIGMQGYMYGEIPYISRQGQKRIIINKFLPLERVYEQTSPAIGCLISEQSFSFKSVLEKYTSTINRFDFFMIYGLDDDCLYLCTRSIYDSFTNDESLIPRLSLKDIREQID